MPGRSMIKANVFAANPFFIGTLAVEINFAFGERIGALLVAFI